MQHLTLSENEWRRRLGVERFHVLREAATEVAFSGRYTNNTASGCYRCAGCHLDLFDSDDKCDAGSGWPSFTRPVADDRITNHGDAGDGTVRAETRCARCDGHLGHLVADGPSPAGRCYRINSASLDFRARDVPHAATG